MKRFCNHESQIPNPKSRPDALTRRFSWLRTPGQLIEKAFRPPRYFRQPPQLNLRACSQQLQELTRMPREVDFDRAPIGPSAVGVGKSVLAAKLPRAEKLSRPVEDRRVGCERRHRATDE